MASDDAEALDAAITHAKEVADSYADTAPDCACAREHLQLARWLRELRELRELRVKPMTLETWVGVASQLEVAYDTVELIQSKHGPSEARRNRSVLWELYKLWKCLNELPQLDEAGRLGGEVVEVSGEG